MMKSKYILALTIPAIFGCAVNEITPEAPGAEEGLIPITSWTMRTANPES